MAQYRYELRRAAIVATGHLEQTDSLEVGDRVEIVGYVGNVRLVEPLPGEQNNVLSFSRSRTASG